MTGIVLSRVSERTLHLQPTVAMRDAVGNRSLPPGAKRPSSRTLAGELGVSRNHATAVYDQLVAEGFLIGDLGRGTFVPAGRTDPPPVDSEDPLPPERSDGKG